MTAVLERPGVHHHFEPRGAAIDLLRCKAGEVLMAGPAGCVAAETELWDPVARVGRRIDELCASGERPWVQTLAGPVRAEVPFRKGVADLFSVTLANGKSCTVTSDHLFLTPDGWRFAEDCVPGTELLSASPADAPHCSETGAGWSDRCSQCSYQCDPLLPRGSVADRAFAPSQSDALSRTRARWLQDAQASTTARSRAYRAFDHRATANSADLRFGEPWGARRDSALATLAAESGAYPDTLEPGSSLSPRPPRSCPASHQLAPSTQQSGDVGSTLTLAEVPQSARLGTPVRAWPGVDSATPDCIPAQQRSEHASVRPAPFGRSVREHAGSSPQSCSHFRSQWVPITAISYVRTDTYYDLHVPGDEHYLANGIWSHNTGKSRACLEKGHLLSLRNPDSRGLILRKTQKSLASTGLVTFRQKVAKEGIASGVLKWFGGSTEQPAGYRYANGSFVAVGGLDDPDKIMSSEYDWIYIQEATDVTEGDWEACTSRLRNGVISFQQLLADCNPAQATHWLNRRCEARRTVMLHSRHEDNPVYFDDAGHITPAGRQYIEGVLDRLTGVRYLRLRKGIWAAAEGLVYDDWDPAVHLVDRLPEGSDTWRRWWGIDFGYSNPFVLQCWAEDPDGRLWLYREIYMSHRLVEDHVKAIKKIVCPDGEWIEPKPQAIVCDHNAEDRATFERHLGRPTVAARKAPTAAQKGLVALQETQTRMKVQPDGKPRLFAVRDCLVERDQALVDAKLPTCFAEEVTGYVWPSDVKPDQREHPVKENDHACDTARYVVGQVDLGKSKYLRWVA